jgi:hypothetical protein
LGVACTLSWTYTNVDSYKVNGSSGSDSDLEIQEVTVRHAKTRHGSKTDKNSIATRTESSSSSTSDVMTNKSVIDTDNSNDVENTKNTKTRVNKTK